MNGLSSQEAAARLAANGPNEIRAHRVTGWDILWRQFTSPLLWLLCVAALISFALMEWVDGALILLFVLINTALGFFQEFRAEHSLALLSQLVEPTSRVRRDGVEARVPSRDLVVGDRLLVQAGDILAADATVVSATALLADESVLTGESEPVNKQVGDIIRSGTRIVSGAGEGDVEATATATALGKTATLTAEAERVSDLQRDLGKFSAFLLKLIGATLVIIFLVNAIKRGPGADLGELLIFSIALAVSVIPEALPTVVAISLSRGAMRMAHRGVVVKRLSSIEDLGGIDILCTDKTGTLTQNKLKVEAVFGGREETLELAGLGARGLHGHTEDINPFDVAIAEALDAKQRAAVSTWNLVSELPFDPERRRNSAVVTDGKTTKLVVRGAPEALYACCLSVDANMRRVSDSWIKEQGRKGCRVLAIATKETADPSDEKGLSLVGMVAFKDPVKEDAAAAMNLARRLNVRVVMLTGDSPDVALAVAQEVGIPPEDVHSRVTPEQKYDFIRKFQAAGSSVGFLGEGINDAPALKAAHVGLVVQNASDIAREAADIVLMERSLSVIVEGIRLGRATFANTRTYLRAILGSNFGNFYAIAFATLFIHELPLLPLQILLLDLLGDFPMVSLSTDYVDPSDLKRPGHSSIRELVALATVLGVVSTAFDLVFFSTWIHAPVDVLRTNWFIGSVLTQLALVFSIRTRRFFLSAHPPSPIISGVLLSVGLIAIALPYLAIGRQAFGFIAPSPTDLILVLAIVAAYLVATEGAKLLFFRLEKKKRPA
jgi:Mg2+-importing ATPase